MTVHIDSGYALNFGLAGAPVQADFPGAALPEQGSAQPNSMPFVGELDRLLSPRGSAQVLSAWIVPRTTSQEVLSPGGFTDALDSAARRLNERQSDVAGDATPPDAAAALRRLARELRDQLALRGLARENQSLLLQG